MGNNDSKLDNRGYRDRDRAPRGGRDKAPNAKPRVNQKAPKPVGNGFDRRRRPARRQSKQRLGRGRPERVGGRNGQCDVLL